MTRGELRTLVCSWLDDPNQTYFTPAQVNVWLNKGQNEVQKRLIQAGENYYVKRMLGYTVQNVDTYALPTDCKKINKLEIVTAGTVSADYNQSRTTLTPVTLVQLDIVSQQTGTPAVYNIKRNAFTLRPVPDNIYPMYLSQSYRVVDMTSDADIPDVPEDYQEFIAVLATFDGYVKDDRDPSAFIVGKRDYYEKLLKQDADNRDVSTSKSVVCMDDAGWGPLW